MRDRQGHGHPHRGNRAASMPQARLFVRSFDRVHAMDLLRKAWTSRFAKRWNPPSPSHPHAGIPRPRYRNRPPAGGRGAGARPARLLRQMEEGIYAGMDQFTPRKVEPEPLTPPGEARPPAQSGSAGRADPRDRILGLTPTAPPGIVLCPAPIGCSPAAVPHLPSPQGYDEPNTPRLHARLHHAPRCRDDGQPARSGWWRSSWWTC